MGTPKVSDKPDKPRAPKADAARALQFWGE